MAVALTDTSVATFSLAPIEFIEIAMHPDQVHVQARKQPGQGSPPGRELDDVVHDQVIARQSEGGEAPVKPREEPRSHLMPPVERPSLLAALRQHPTCDQMIGGDMHERCVERFLEGLRQRELARAGGPVEEYD